MNVRTEADGLLGMRRPQAQPRRTSRFVYPIAAVVFALSCFALVRYFTPHSVSAFVVRRTNITVALRGPGTLEATNRITVSAPIEGRLTDITVDRNNVVSRGQLLARLESSNLTNELEATKASANAADRSIGAANADREGAIAALVNAQATYDRQSALRLKGAASQTAVDEALSTLNQSQAELNRADRVIEQNRAQAQSALAQVRSAEARLADTAILAPFSGIVVSRDRNVGDVLTAGSSILQLIDPTTIVLTARYDESSIAKLMPGQQVEVSFVSQPNNLVAGHVKRLGRLVDAETREFTVDVALHSLPTNWALGQRAKASISADTVKNVLAVPKSFIASRGGRAGVWVADAGRAYWRQVELGRTTENEVEISQGVRAGEILVISQRIYPSMKLRLRQEIR